jgi:ATP-dependent Clp protease protease subunit
MSGVMLRLLLVASTAAAFVPGGRAHPAVLGGVRSAATRMQTVDGVRVGPPPDLASLLLNNRIVYLGMPLVPAVTELAVAELLFLNYDNAGKPIYVYINSIGTAGGMGDETDAFAITDTMDYVSPPIETICIGTAYGTAAMLLASGAKGKRQCLPNAEVMLHQPRSAVRGQASDIAIKAKEVLRARHDVLSIIAEKTGNSLEKVTADSARTRYLTADQALEYGIIDKVLRNEEDLPSKPSFLSSL